MMMIQDCSLLQSCVFNSWGPALETPWCPLADPFSTLELRILIEMLILPSFSKNTPVHCVFHMPNYSTLMEKRTEMLRNPCVSELCTSIF